MAPVKTSTSVKTVLTVIGSLLLIISGLISVTSTTYFQDHGNIYDVFHTIGFQNHLWYIIVICTVLLSLVGYLLKRPVSIVLFFVFTPIFIIITAASSFLTTLEMGFGMPIPDTALSGGFYLAVLGGLSVTSAAGIAAFDRPKRSVTTGTPLDDF